MELQVLAPRLDDSPSGGVLFPVPASAAIQQMLLSKLITSLQFARVSHVTDRAADRAAQMRADVLPIPIRQILQPEPPAVAAKLVSLGRPDAIDRHRLEARRSVDRAIPIAKRTCRFSAPGPSRM